MAHLSKFARKFARNLALAASALAGIAAVPAHATVDVTAYAYVPPAVYGGLTVNGNSFGGEAGRFLSDIHDLTTGTTIQRFTFCIDALTAYFTYSPYQIAAVSAAIADPVKQAQLAALLAHADSTISGAGNAAAQSAAGAGFALAVWEVIYESANSGYSLTSGNFSAYGDFTLGAIADGTSYLGNVESLAWTGTASDLRVLQSVHGDSQNQIYLESGVPEPATWLTMLVGFALLGSALRRRAKVTFAA